MLWLVVLGELWPVCGPGSSPVGIWRIPGVPHTVSTCLADGVLFVVFGSSGAGKTSAMNALRDRVSDLALHDFDEIDVPQGGNRLAAPGV
jgi:ABC-type taurine transport system ATPase subunit